MYEKRDQEKNRRENNEEKKKVLGYQLKNTAVFNKTNEPVTNDENKSTVAELDLRLEL